MKNEEIELFIKNALAAKRYGAFKVEGLNDGSVAYLIKTVQWFGLAVPNVNKKEINEEFSNCSIKNKILTIDGIDGNYLILSCIDKQVERSFGTLAYDFIREENRQLVVNDPIEWWKEWRKLVGNVILNKRVYDIIAEMLVLNHLYDKEKAVKWNAISRGTHDIETKTVDYEVKSTIKRYGYQVTISSQFQLENNGELKLIFIRLEEAQVGYSINDLVKKLVLKGYSENQIEKELKTIGLEKGRSVRNDKYKVLESKEYTVDEKFPMITPNSFVGGKIPANIEEIVYTINLSSLQSKRFL